MLKNILKRTLGSLLAIVMIVTTVSVAGPTGWFPTSEALVATQTVCPDAYIVVPETFYLTPALTESNTVQYYVNNSLSGTSITPDETRDAASGKIWFNVSSGTVTDLQYTILGTNKKNVAMDAGADAAAIADVTLDTGLAAAGTRVLEWIFTCSINGVAAEYHAFSVAYAPYYTPVGAAANGKNGNAGTQMQGVAWISGVHSCTDCDPYPAAGTDDDNYIIGGYHARTAWNGEWNRPLTPMITEIATPTNNDENISDWLSTTADGACPDASFTLYDVDKSASGWGSKKLDLATRSHIANITVDVSRNRNFSTVPNVTTGFFVSDLKRDSKYMGSFGGYIANYDGDLPAIDFWFSQNHYESGGGSFAATSGVDTVFFGGNADASTDNRGFVILDETQDGNKNTLPYNGVWNRATPNGTGTSMHYIHAATCCEYGGNWIYLNYYLTVNVTAVDKSALRNKVFQKQLQANAKAIDNYAFVREKLATAYQALGDPTATQTAVDSAAAGLDGINDSIYQTETIYAKHINQRTGAPMAGSSTEQLSVRRSYGATTVTPNSYAGYSFTGMRKTYDTSASSFGLFDANAWAESGCTASGNGVSAVEYDGTSRTITVQNTGTETNTAYLPDNVLTSGLSYIEVDPSVAYTLDFDYASASRGRVGVICYDEDGGYIGNIWLYDSFKATGSDSLFRHCTEVIFPQSSPYLFYNAKRYDVHYIVLTFGIGAENSQSAAACAFRNVSLTPSDELFDFAQWSFRSCSFKSALNTAGIAAKSYDSETKTLSLSSTKADVCTAYTTGNVLTDSGIYESQNCTWNYIPVEPGTTYAVSGLYAGTGSGQITVARYDAIGAYLGSVCLSAASAEGGILAKTGSSTNFDPFYASFTTGADDAYISLAFGGKANTDATELRPVTGAFRDVKVHAETASEKLFILYYRPNPYTVVFDACGGTGTMADQAFTYDEAQNLTANAFTRRGYTFEGWATTENGVKTFADGEEVVNLTGVEDGVVRLYACWSTETYTIRYDEVGGTIEGDCLTEYDITTSILLPTAVKPGYTLTGWRADNSGIWGPDLYKTDIVLTGMYGNVTLTAVWRANNYSVAFNANGGEGAAMANQSFVYGTAQALTANAYSRAGYSFRGWALTSTAEEPLYANQAHVQDLTTEPGAVVTLYAVWGASSYSIIYSTDGGTILDQSYTKTYSTAEQIYLPLTVEKPGYTFSGWKPTGSTGTWNAETTYTGILNSGMLGNVTLQAQWTPRSCMITYATDGGTITTANGKYTTAYDVNTAVTLPSARKTGYTFVGWQANGVDNWGDSVYTTGDVGTGHYGNVTLTAVWSGITYYVQFNGNESDSGVMFNQSFTYGESSPLNPNEFVRNGYRFLGWSTSRTATTAAYVDGASVTNLSAVSGATVTLYAVWEKDSFTITYDANGGTIGTPGTQTYTVSDTVTLPIVTRRGYTLVGWRTAEDSGSWVTWETYNDSVAAGCYGNVTLTAQWSKDSYTITYDPVGGTMSEGYTTVYDVDTVIVLPTVTRAGYSFDGWQADAAWNNVVLTDTAPENALGNVTLTALWSQKVYYVRFNANGGIGTMNDELIRFGVSQALTMNAFTRDGYSFAGWATSEAGSIAYADGDTVLNLSQTDGSIVNLYAVWNSCNFTISYNLNGALNENGTPATLISTNVEMDGEAVTLRAYNVQETLINGTLCSFLGWAYSKSDADRGIVAYANKASFSLNAEVLESAEVSMEPKPTITLYAVWSGQQIRLTGAEGSTTVIDTERGFIYGLKAEITRTELENDYLAVIGSGTLVIESGTIHTGTLVQLVNNFTGDVIEEYQIIIFGDVNGDGLINSSDVTYLRMINAKLIDSSFTSPNTFAGDLCADGEITPTDVTYLRMMQARLCTYDQAEREIVANEA